MACNCLQETLNEFVEKCVKPQMKKNPHVEGSVKTDWDGKAIFFTSEPKFPIPLKIKTKYRPLKKDGSPMKSDKVLENNFIMKYCPLCGVKF